MVKVVYRFVTGEEQEIDVSRDVYDAISELDKREQNSERRETRRHVSFDMLIGVHGAQFADERVDTLRDVLRKLEHEDLREAILSLEPQQQELLKQVYVERRSYADIAREMGVDRSAVRKRMERIYRKLKKFFI